MPPSLRSTLLVLLAALVLPAAAHAARAARAGQPFPTNLLTVRDPATLTAESDQLLAQDTTYLLVATRGIRDANGHRVHEADDNEGAGDKAYRKQLRRALEFAGLEDDVAAASLFTTQSVTAILEKIRA